jgi:type IV secretory pathway TraG/TraD family ATPase VirD4
MADRTQSSILSLTSGILEPFVSSPMLSGLFAGGTTIDLDDMLRGKIVLLNLPIQQYEYAGKLAQILFKHLLEKKIEGRDLTRIPNPVCLFIDEYQYFTSPYDFLFLSTARSSRAGCILMTQNISNLYAQIGGSGRVAEEKVNALLALTNHKFFLAQNNSQTNEFASKILGMGIHYQVMPHEFTMLKRGGAYHQGIVEAIATATGKKFSNGKNYLRLQFQQPWHG